MRVPGHKFLVPAILLFAGHFDMLRTGMARSCTTHLATYFPKPGSMYNSRKIMHLMEYSGEDRSAARTQAG